MTQPITTSRAIPVWAFIVAMALVILTALGTWVLAPTGPSSGAGQPGPQGPAGETGPQGPAGEQGPTGAQGATGPVGPSGPAGATGATGPTGPVGPAGAQGFAGATGATGATGNVGPAGPSGAKGASGPRGEKGETGPQGATGSVGAQGATGPQGQTGPDGPAGEDGPVSVYTTSTYGTAQKQTQTLTLSAGTWFVVLTAAATQDPNQGQGLVNCVIETTDAQGPVQMAVMNFTLFEDDIESPSGAMVVTTDGATFNTVGGDCAGGSSNVTFSGLTLTATRVTTLVGP